MHLNDSWEIVGHVKWPFAVEAAHTGTAHFHLCSVGQRLSPACLLASEIALERVLTVCLSNSCVIYAPVEAIPLWTVLDYECQFQAMPAPIHHQENNLTTGPSSSTGFLSLPKVCVHVQHSHICTFEQIKRHTV